jgi:hypothetical protein
MKKLEDNYQIFFYLVLIIIFFKVFIFYDHYPYHDEITTFDRYLEWHRVFRKDAPNNHFILSVIGILTKYIFGFNFLVLRFISFVFFILISLYFIKNFKNFYLILIFFLIIFSSKSIFNYSYVFRGYYLSSFLSVLIFIDLLSIYIYKNKKNLKITFLLCFLLFAHSLYTLYIVAPVLFVTFVNSLNIRKFYKYFLEFFVYFFIPTIIIIYLNIFVTGFAEKFSGNLNIDFILNNFLLVLKESFEPGFKAIFLNDYVSQNNSSLLSSFANNAVSLFRSDFTIFCILLTALIISLIKSYMKKIDILDKIVISFFIFYLLIGREPFLRVYVGIIYFFIFYIFFNIPDFKIPKKKYFKIVYLLVFILALFNIQPSRNNQEVKSQILKIDKSNLTCEEFNSFLDDYEIWVLINFYQDKCYYYWDGKKNVLGSTKINNLYKKRFNE